MKCILTSREWIVFFFVSFPPSNYSVFPYTSLGVSWSPRSFDSLCPFPCNTIFPFSPPLTFYPTTLYSISLLFPMFFCTSCEGPFCGLCKFPFHFISTYQAVAHRRAAFFSEESGASTPVGFYVHSGVNKTPNPKIPECWAAHPGLAVQPKLISSFEKIFEGVDYLKFFKVFLFSKII